MKYGYLYHKELKTNRTYVLKRVVTQRHIQPLHSGETSYFSTGRRIRKMAGREKHCYIAHEMHVCTQLGYLHELARTTAEGVRGQVETRIHVRSIEERDIDHVPTSITSIYLLACGNEIPTAVSSIPRPAERNLFPSLGDFVFLYEINQTELFSTHHS